MERKKRDNSLKAALIGYGYWGKIMYNYLCENPFIELVKVCGIDLKEKGIFTKNIESVLSNSEIDMLFVCTPINAHYDICKRGLKAGKHIFCEKPTVKSRDDFMELEQISENKGKILYTDYIYTVSPSICKMKEILGECGEIFLIKGEISQFGNFYPEDYIYEVIGVHLISVLAFLFEDVQILDYQFNGIHEFHNTYGCMSLKLKNNIKVLFELNLLHPKKVRTFSVYGSNGSIVFDMMDQTTLRLCKCKECNKGYIALERKEWKFDEFNNLENAIQDFINCVNEKKNMKNKIVSRVVNQVLQKIDEI